MTIKRPTIGALYKENKEAISYCPDCAKGNHKQMMEERIYQPDPLTGKTVIPGDANLWRQCHRCGLILPIYNLKREGRLKSELTIQQNPFDRGQTKVIENNRIGKSNTKRGDKKGEWDYVNDPDLKIELRRGSKLLGYSSSD